MEITKKNFFEEIDNITKNLKKSSFIGFDAEFTAILPGENFKNRLFDTNEDRYNKIKNEISKMIMCQIGITMFQYDRDTDTYVAVPYTFHLCPQVIGEIDQSFVFQASTLKFLCRHNFNFNKFTYDGLPYLSKVEESKIRNQLQNNTLNKALIQNLELEDEVLLQSYCSQVSKWQSIAEEDTMYLDIKNPVMRYIVHNEIRTRFPGVLTTDSLGNSNKVLIYKDKYVEGANSAPIAILEDSLMSNLLGFSQIIKLLAIYQKPIVGHNVFLDLMLVHSQFIGPLPKRYISFKKNIHELFPHIYDTKFISHEMYRKLSFEEVWKSNALKELYEFFSERKCKKLELGVNPIRLRTPFGVKQSYHEAGWDSYCSGYCFIRLGHWAACENRGQYRPLGPTENIAALATYRNRINVIRAAVQYMNITGDDPLPTRPKLLHVRTLKKCVINVHEVASALSSFGSIDVKPYGRRAALVAAGSQLIADKILKQFNNSREYQVSVYSSYRHGVGRVTIWSGALLTGSLVLYFLQNNIKTKSSLI